LTLHPIPLFPLTFLLLLMTLGQSLSVFISLALYLSRNPFHFYSFIVISLASYFMRKNFACSDAYHLLLSEVARMEDGFTPCSRTLSNTLEQVLTIVTMQQDEFSPSTQCVTPRRSSSPKPSLQPGYRSFPNPSTSSSIARPSKLDNPARTTPTTSQCSSGRLNFRGRYCGKVNLPPPVTLYYRDPLITPPPDYRKRSPSL